MIPAGVEINYQNNVLTIKGTKGSLTQDIHPAIEVSTDDNAIKVKLMHYQNSLLDIHIMQNAS